MKVVRLLLLAVLVAGLAGAATITTYNTRAAWDTAVAGFGTLTEDFDDAVLEPWLTITSDWPGAGIYNMQWEGVVHSMVPQVENYALSYPMVIGWGADLDLLERYGAGEGIDAWVNLAGGGWTQAGASIPGNYQGFFGFVVSGDSFAEVEFRGAGLHPDGNKETFWMNDMSIAGVPEPGTYALTGLGMMALLLLRRRKA